VWKFANKDEENLTTTSGAIGASAQDWEKRENNVNLLLKILVKDNIIPHIGEYKIVNDIWVTLKDFHEKNTNHLLFLKSKIISIRMEENESISQFCLCISLDLVPII